MLRMPVRAADPGIEEMPVAVTESADEASMRPA